MTIEEFKMLPEQRKKEILVDADKVAELVEESSRNELFQIDDFFVEVQISFLKRYRKILDIYSKINLPEIYSGKALKKFAF